MFKTSTKIAVLLLVVLLGVGIWFFTKPQLETLTLPENIVPVPEPTAPVATLPNSVIGTSVEGREIEQYTYGTGETELLFVGGMHGGYEWNSVLVAYTMIDEIETGMLKIPDNLTVTIIPVLNPDGLHETIGIDGHFTLADVPSGLSYEAGTGRFNAHKVDLNRNFDCKWQPESSWRGKTVSAGSAAFSEPESAALKALVEKRHPAAVVFWHSQANAVYASECTAGILPQTLALMNTYARAGNYSAVSSFDAYPVTGDAEGWLASIGIPAVTVELGTHANPEWEKNRAGVMAVLSEFSK